MKFMVPFRPVQVLILLTLVLACPACKGQHQFYSLGSSPIKLAPHLQSSLGMSKCRLQWSEGGLLLIQNNELVISYDTKMERVVSACRADSVVSDTTLLRLVQCDPLLKSLGDVHFLPGRLRIQFSGLEVYGENIFQTVLAAFSYFTTDRSQQTVLATSFLICSSPQLQVREVYHLPIALDTFDLGYTGSFGFDKSSNGFWFPNSLILDSASTAKTAKIKFSLLHYINDSVYACRAYSCQNRFNRMKERYLSDFNTTIRSGESCSPRVRYLPSLHFVAQNDSVLIGGGRELVEPKSCRLIAALNDQGEMVYTNWLLLRDNIAVYGWLRQGKTLKWSIKLFDYAGNFLSGLDLPNHWSPPVVFSGEIYFLKKADDETIFLERLGIR